MLVNSEHDRLDLDSNSSTLSATVLDKKLAWSIAVLSVGTHTNNVPHQSWRVRAGSQDTYSRERHVLNEWTCFRRSLATRREAAEALSFRIFGGGGLGLLAYSPSARWSLLRVATLSSHSASPANLAR